MQRLVAASPSELSTFLTASSECPLWLSKLLLLYYKNPTSCEIRTENVDSEGSRQTGLINDFWLSFWLSFRSYFMLTKSLNDSRQQADDKAVMSTGCDVADCAGYLALLHFVHGLVHLLLEQVSFGRQCLSVCPWDYWLGRLQPSVLLDSQTGS